MSKLFSLRHKTLFTVFLLSSGNILLANEDKTSRQERQRARIENGVDSGALNKREQKRLNNRMEKIRDVKEGVRADGVVTESERDLIQDLRDKQSKHIYKQKHDAQTGMSRREKQRNRIQDGVESGALTKREQKRLNNQMERIRDVREGMRADGDVSIAEKAYIQKLRDEQSDRIFRQKHDDQSSDFVKESDLQEAQAAHSH